MECAESVPGSRDRPHRNLGIESTDSFSPHAKKEVGLQDYSCDQIMCAPGILVQAYSPLGNPSCLSKKDTELVVMEDPVIQDIAAKHKASPAQVHSKYTKIRPGATILGLLCL